VISFPRRLIGILATSCAFGAGAAALPSPASAGLIDLNACDGSALSHPFTPWLDFNLYKLAPGGSFEGALSGWSLTGGARQASGSESFGVTGSAGSSSLLLPAGAVATSPQTCVNAAYPTFRLFTRASTLGSTLLVSVVYGNTTIPVGVVVPMFGWQPTVVMLTGSAVPGALNGGTANIALRFTALTGAVQVDDTYVDPHGRCC